ncbi:MAG: outer membrane protein assembly factor BamA [Candidatus Aminicenantes bacterium]|nr:outer membrane protein assembly factor BamA [Candidatus Aminicenantes bacterium]
MLKFIRDSSLGERKLAPFFLLFFFILFVPKESFSLSQKPSPLIAKVSIWIDGQPDGEDIAELIPVKEGEEFSLKKISSSIKQIYRTGLFSDVQVLKEGEQEIQLTFLLTRRYFIRKIIFRGRQKVSRKDLKESLLSLSEGSFFSDEKVSKAVGELKEALTKKGYFQPEIEAVAERDFKSPTLNVIFEINSAKTYIIKKIAFSGEKIIPEAELKKQMKIKEGDVYVPSVIDEDLTRLKEFYSSKGYQRTEIDIEEARFDEGKQGAYLTLRIIPHEKIEIVVEGAQVPLRLLEPIWEPRIFEEWGLAEGEAKIIGYLRKKGYLFCSVKSSIEKVDNEMRVIYKVSPGEKFKIKDISFEGQEYFTPEQLKRELASNANAPFSSWIDGEKLFELPAEIEFLYKTRGFPDARVSLNFFPQGKEVRAYFFIEEGSQEKIEKISFEGTNLFNKEILLKQIGSFEGGFFYQPKLQKDMERLVNFYLNQGVRGTEIRARVEQIRENLFSVFFSLKEGKKVKIERILTTGNVVTKRRTIIRELRVKEGEYALYERIRESKRRLEKLGIFTEVKMDEIPISTEKENLIVRVREGKRNYAGLGVGLETRSERQTFALWNNPVRLRGTVEFIKSNVLGSAAQLSLVGQFSLKERRGVFSWDQPYFFGLPIQTYMNAWLEREERESFTFDRQGVSLTAIKSISKNLLFLMTMRWARTNFVTLQIEESEVDRQHRPFSATSVSGSFIWDRRDEPFNTERGSFLSFVVERAFPFLKSDSNYLKSFIKYKQFIPVFSGVTFSTTTRLGLGGGRKPIPIHERFFGGGSNSFRGARFDELGPKDPVSLKPVGGEALFLLNFELTFPLISAIKDLSGAIFYDKGNVFEDTKHFSVAALEDAVGVGIRYRTPLGPVRLEVGWNLDAKNGETKPLVFITIGNVF